MARKKASKDINCLTLRERSSILIPDRSSIRKRCLGLVDSMANTQDQLAQQKEEFERTLGSIERIMRTSRKSSTQIQRFRHLNTRRFSDATLLRSNKKYARSAWGELSRQSLARLADLTGVYRLSVTAGPSPIFRRAMVHHTFWSAQCRLAQPLLRDPDNCRKAPLRSGDQTLGFQSDSLQGPPFERIRRLRRC